MTTPRHLLLTAASLWTLACREPPTQSVPRAITREDEARAAVLTVAEECFRVIGAVSDSFPEPYVIRGAAGSASVTGVKATTRTTFTSGYRNDTIADLAVAYEGFETGLGFTATGHSDCSHTAWYYYQCQLSCTAHYEASDTVGANDLVVGFSYLNARYQDRVSLWATRSTEYASQMRYSGTFTTSAGITFTFALW